jgi:hypothetical protein
MSEVISHSIKPASRPVDSSAVRGSLVTLAAAFSLPVLIGNLGPDSPDHDPAKPAYEAMQLKFRQLDDGPTYIFNSLALCTQTFPLKDCQEAYEAANNSLNLMAQIKESQNYDLYAPDTGGSDNKCSPGEMLRVDSRYSDAIQVEPRDKFLTFGTDSINRGSAVPLFKGIDGYCRPDGQRVTITLEP